MKLWWLSFCDPERPKGQHFLGATVAPGESIVDACKAAHANRSNPGGQVMGVPIPENLRAHFEPVVGSLLSRAQCEELDAQVARARADSTKIL